MKMGQRFTFEIHNYQSTHVSFAMPRLLNTFFSVNQSDFSVLLSMQRLMCSQIDDVSIFLKLADLEVSLGFLCRVFA